MKKEGVVGSEAIRVRLYGFMLGPQAGQSSSAILSVAALTHLSSLSQHLDSNLD